MVEAQFQSTDINRNGKILSINDQIGVPVASMVNRFGRKWASQLTTFLSDRFITDRHHSSVFIRMCKPEEANGACPTDEESHMVKAWSYVNKKNGNTVDQEDDIRDEIEEKMEEVCR